jgi:uncharacterized protein (DUF924 family)
MTETTSEDVLRFWIGEPGDPPLAKAASWWKKDEAFDREIKERFQETLERGVRGELADWEKTPRGRLALVILYDQFSRNMFRGTPRSFAQDELARAVARKALDAGDDRVLRSAEVAFLLMPLMHAEDIATQNECLQRFTTLRDSDTDEQMRANNENSVKYARMHMAIVERFGRFPHRNEILGRPTTPEEADFLKQPNSSF